jgi:pyruvate/2-oxoglutarate dehydrogenase complex dihydrolipoamide dehydrogenase (E3) component
VVGAGPAGLAAGAEACGSQHEVIVLERSPSIGGQLALAGAAPMHEETARAHLANARRLLADADVRVGVDVDSRAVAELEPDAVVVATGAVPYRPPLPLEGRVVSAWDVLAGAPVEGQRAVVADWGGDPSGLAAADVLAARGLQVTVALAAIAPGESIHQYTRNVYLERLYRAGIRLEHHLELAAADAGRAVFRNLFAPELETELVADTLILALGRVPADRLAPELRALGLTVEEAGDCRSPRSLEEATLEGTLAARRLLSLP